MIIDDTALTAIREGCVLTGGSFDPLHSGHVTALHQARLLADQADAVLVCAVEDQPQKHLPLVPIAERAKVLERFADVVVMQGTQDTPSLIRTLKPKYYVKGKDWENNLPETHLSACGEVGAETRFTNGAQRSSSAMIATHVQSVNAQKLDAFEQWVSTQKPAEKAWEPVTDYSWEARKEIEGPHAQLIKEAFAPGLVLDYGCGFGHLVRLLNEAGVPAVGWDPYYGGSLPDEYQGALLNAAHGLVICREVLEHLTVRDLAIAVRNLVKLSSQYVYVTTRFTAKPHLLDFDTSDNLDPTHITMLNQDLLRLLFVLEGCTRRADLEAKLDWRKLGRCLVYQVPA